MKNFRFFTRPSLNLSEKEKKMANDNHLSLRYML